MAEEENEWQKTQFKKTRNSDEEQEQIHWQYQKPVTENSAFHKEAERSMNREV